MSLCHHQHAVLSFEHEKIKKMLRKEHVGYVLVTAKKTNHPEKFQVELSYDGEASLASYLVDGAQNVFDEIFLSEENE